MKLIVTKNYIPDDEDFFYLEKGTIISIIEEYKGNPDWRNWMTCLYMDNKLYIPKQYISNIDGVSVMNQDYTNIEIPVNEGDTFISTKELNGWHFGYLETKPNELGWVPSECLSEYKKSLN